MCRTQIATDSFALQLPGAWSEIKTADRALSQYRSENSLEQLSVSLFRFRARPAESEFRLSLDRYLQTRIEMESRAGNGSQVKITPLTISEQGNGIVGTYSGVDPDRGRQFLSFTIANFLHIVTFYYEALDMEPSQFEERSREVLGTVSVAE